MIGSPSQNRGGLEVHDLLSALTFLLFAVASFIWPDTGIIPGLGLARGYLVGGAYLLGLGVILGLGRIDFTDKGPLLAFARQFYPQLFSLAVFEEAILLSSRAFGGASHDALFAAFDEAVFGYQPARVFSEALSGSTAVNELMFGAYFLYFILFAITPWLAWFKGDRKEAAREINILSGYVLVVFTFYIFFRVQGPKYWLPDLNAQWYTQFHGLLFTTILTHAFEGATLSGAAFPSTHVAMSLILTTFAARQDRRLLPLYATALPLIIAATVYIHAHWFADSLGGLLTAVVLLVAFRRLGPFVQGVTEAVNRALYPTLRLDPRGAHGVEG